MADALLKTQFTLALTLTGSVSETTVVRAGELTVSNIVRIPGDFIGITVADTAKDQEIV